MAQLLYALQFHPMLEEMYTAVTLGTHAEVTMQVRSHARMEKLFALAQALVAEGGIILAESEVRLLVTIAWGTTIPLYESFVTFFEAHFATLAPAIRRVYTHLKKGAAMLRLDFFHPPRSPDAVLAATDWEAWIGSL